MADSNLAFVTVPAIRHRQQRIFRCHYFCDCENEWSDEMLTAGISWCQACDGAAEPYYVEEFEEDRPEWED